MMKDFISILLVEDHPLMIRDMRSFLEVDPNLKLVAVFKYSKDVLSFLESNEDIDLVIMDSILPGSELDGLQITERIGERFPQIKVLFCSAINNPINISKAKRLGARGYIYKGAVENGEEIRSAIDKVMKGYFVWSEFEMPKFTRAEMEVIFLLHAGCITYKEIAFELLKEQYDGETNKISAKDLESKEKNIAGRLGSIMRTLDMNKLIELIMWIKEIEPKKMQKFGSATVSPNTGILVIDDHQLKTLKLFNSALEDKPIYQILAQVENSEQALALLQEDEKFKLVIVNCQRNGDRISDVELMRKIHEHHPQVKVMFYGPDSDAIAVKNTIIAGAHSYIWKRNEGGVATAIRKIMDGEITIVPNIIGVLVVDDDNQSKISNILNSLLADNSEYQIIAELKNSEHVIKYLKENKRIELVIVNCQRSGDRRNNLQLKKEIKDRYPSRVKILFIDSLFNTETEKSLKGADAEVARTMEYISIENEDIMNTIDSLMKKTSC